jgi:putative ABC transport system permease protein
MRFLTFIMKNAWRRPLRSALTAFAVAVAVGAVVALVGIAAGFERSFMRVYESADADLVVCRAGLRQRLTSTIDESVGLRIASLPGVKSVISGLVDVVSFDDAGMYGVVVQGWPADSVAFDHLHFRSGRKLESADSKVAVLGSLLALNLDKTVGDTVELYEGEVFKVIGVFEAPSVFENGSLVVPLRDLQRLLDRSGQVTGFTVTLQETAAGKPVAEVRGEIEQMGLGLTAMPVREHVETLTEIRVAHAMAWITSAVAMIIGAAGMMNTMMTSVHERTSEIGILRAVGWRKRRVVWMVLSESFVLSVVGACAGALGAVAVVWLLTRLPAASGLIDCYVPLSAVGQGFAVAILVGLLGGLISAVGAARMLPTDALCRP